MDQALNLNTVFYHAFVKKKKTDLGTFQDTLIYRVDTFKFIECF